MATKFKQLIVATAMAVGFSSAAGAEDLKFVLTNETSLGVVGVYVSHAGTKQWEENLIEGGVLAPGYEIDVVIADGRSVCVYDLKSEFESGDVFEDYGLDLCELGAYTLTEK